MNFRKYYIHFVSASTAIFSLCLEKASANEPIKFVNTNFIQFELGEINKNFNAIISKNIENRDKITNLAAGEITVAAGNASLKNQNFLLIYSLTKNKSNKTYNVEKSKIDDGKYCVTIIVNDLADGYTLYEDLLILFNILEEVKILFDKNNVEFDENFKESIYKAKYRADTNMANFYNTVEGKSWMKKINQINKANEVITRSKIAFEEWVKLHKSANDHLAFDIWTQLYGKTL